VQQIADGDVPRIGSAVAGLLVRLNGLEGERVRGWITVQKATQNDGRTERPGQTQGEDPDARKPHADVVVQIAGLDQLAGPGIETG
jgi:hypothetical protein